MFVCLFCFVVVVVVVVFSDEDHSVEKSIEMNITCLLIENILPAITYYADVSIVDFIYLKVEKISYSSY